jgi:hypothetical protein
MKKLASTIPILLSAVVCHGAEATNNAPSRLDFPSFHLISERNIFNANRYVRRAGEAPRRVEPDRRYTRTESFALVGTMSYEKGRFAFFEGSSSQFNQVLKVSDVIGGFKIAEVTPNSVKLEPTSTNSQPVELPVGMQLKRQDEGEWKLSERTDTPRSYASSSSSSYRSSSRSSSSSSRSSFSSSGPENSEVLRRLMQQRGDNGPAETPADGETAKPVESTAAEEPRPENGESPDKAGQVTEKRESTASGGADDILKRLMEKREQENK